MRQRFSDAGYELGTGDGLIITPFLSDGEKLRAIARGLLRRGVHAAAVTYPIVERGRGRLRFICSASHTRADVDETLQALIDAEAEAATAPTSHEDRDLREERDEKSTRFDLANWADALTAYPESNPAELPTPAPHLAVTVVRPGEGADLVVRINEHGVTREPGSTGATPACSLRLVDDEATAALCSRNVESLLESVIAGTCVLSGHTQPFVWLIGRLSDWQSTTSGV
ncbi:hypothetical protein ACFWRV_35875 [Streptomyces sp. NPDC058576]|uniref:hypothetical protein n=1 Tax=Streptomyces sp. NPDC058576 TaxID=3346547 RepID=UPI00365F03EA